jgi:hypothetical protein
METYVIVFLTLSVCALYGMSGKPSKVEDADD